MKIAAPVEGTKAAATIGVVVPSYNYGRYLPERLESIRQQDRPADALAFLDDASSDGSWAIAAPLLEGFACRVVTRANTVNTGNVLRQWLAGVELLETELVWIAEADDRAAPGLLAALAPWLEADPEAALAFCDSAAIGGEGERIAADSQDYLAAYGDTALARNGSFTTAEFLDRFLCPRNLILSVSAVLWRRERLLAALRRMAAEAPLWLCAGDWRAYAEICREPGSVHYVAAPLNDHRRHGGSVTRATPGAAHFSEVAAMHVHLREILGPEARRDAAMRRYLAELRRAWRLDAAA